MIDRLRLMQAEERIPHALLFCGCEGVGKALAAEALAASLLCQNPHAGQCCGVCASCKALLAGTHPDYFYLEPDSSGKAAKSIKIEAVRILQTDMAKIPLLSARKVVIIEEADKMNEAAANCLLKTIEEPTGQVVFILLTSRAASLLDTIISRCMRVEFGILHRTELEAILTKQGIAPFKAKELAGIADGSVSKALLLQNEELARLRVNALELIEHSNMTVEELLQRAKEMSAHSKEELIIWLSFLAMLYRDMLLLYSGSTLALYNQADMNRLSAMLGSYPPRRLLALLQLVQEYQKRLGTNVNLQLCLEGLYIKFQKLMEE